MNGASENTTAPIQQGPVPPPVVPIVSQLSASAVPTVPRAPLLPIPYEQLFCTFIPHVPQSSNGMSMIQTGGTDSAAPNTQQYPQQQHQHHHPPQPPPPPLRPQQGFHAPAPPVAPQLDASSKAQVDPAPIPPITSTQTAPSQKRAPRQRYYAVARGHVPGVYTSNAEACKQVKGFSNGAMKAYATAAQAHEFLQIRNSACAAVPETQRGAVLHQANKPRSRKKEKPQMFYAVAQGKIPGVYTSANKAKEQIKGLAYGLLKKFPSIQEARAYVFHSGTSTAPITEEEEKRQIERQRIREEIAREAPRRRQEQERLRCEGLGLGRPYLPMFSRYPLNENPSPSDLKTMADADRNRDKKKKRKRSKWEDDDFVYDPLIDGDFFLFDDVREKPDSTEPFLVCAAAHGYIGVVAALLKRGVPVNIARQWLEVEEKWGYDKEWSWNADSALTVAIKGRHLEIVKLLVAAGASKEHKCHHDDSNHYTPRELLSKMPMPEREAYEAAMNTPPGGAAAIPGAEGGAIASEVSYMRDQGIMRAELNGRVDMLRNDLSKYGVPNTERMTKAQCEERILAIQKEILEDPNRIPFDCYSRLTVVSLKSFCRACGLPAGGNKSDLEGRLIEYRVEGNAVPVGQQVVAPVHDSGDDNDDSCATSGGPDANTAAPEELPEGYTNHEQPPKGRRHMMMDPRYVSKECRDALAALTPDGATVADLDHALGLLPKFSLSTTWQSSPMATKVNYASKARAQLLRVGVPTAPSPLESATVGQLKGFLRQCHLPLSGTKSALVDIAKEFVFYHGVAPRTWQDMPILLGSAPMKSGRENDDDGLPTQRRRM